MTAITHNISLANPFVEDEVTQQSGFFRFGLWVPILFLSLIYIQFGHEWDRSTREEDGFNRDAVEQQELAESGSRMYQFAFLGMGAVGGLMFLMPSANRLAIRRSVALPVILLTAWTCASVIWADDTMLTLRRIFTVLCFVALCIGLAKHWTARDLLFFTFVFSLISLALSFAAELAHGTFRPWFGDYRFAGTLHPNTQAIFQASLAISAVGMMRYATNFRAMLLAIVVVAFGFLILTKSRSGLAGCLLSFLAIWLLDTSTQVKYFTIPSGNNPFGDNPGRIADSWSRRP